MGQLVTVPLMLFMPQKLWRSDLTYGNTLSLILSEPRRLTHTTLRIKMLRSIDPVARSLRLSVVPCKLSSSQHCTEELYCSVAHARAKLWHFFRRLERLHHSTELFRPPWPQLALFSGFPQLPSPSSSSPRRKQPQQGTPPSP